MNDESVLRSRSPRVEDKPDVSDPAVEWAKLCSEIEVPDDAATSMWGELLARYSEPQRHYHTLQHIGEMHFWLARGLRRLRANLFDWPPFFMMLFTTLEDLTTKLRVQRIANTG